MCICFLLTKGIHVGSHAQCIECMSQDIFVLLFQFSDLLNNPEKQFHFYCRSMLSFYFMYITVGSEDE